ncbi:transmembrane protein 176 isoform X2 [Etheostoma spectabile]|uniref:transmembrane protein 176 isoform X2 n=1 Tax=Etheostoma spectabile TaxID=54343 RepID=UPI0013AF5760|nr:membrane-spanning 4-domains subfamily A member 12 isoform X2 [Etheostoma spectabile]
MAVAVHRDLTVQVLQDGNAAKLTDRQQAVHAAVKRGDPKCLGVSQVMLGLMVMSYSIPLHFTEVTEVVRLGVPWWSGLTFIATGVVAIVLDKHSTMKILQELSRGIKSALLVFTLAQTAISAVLGFLLLRHRRGFAQYASLTQAASSSPTSLIPPNLN